MTIAAKYEDGVFKPLEDVRLTEGTRVDVHVLSERPPWPKSVREFAAFGMWADRDDIPDGVGLLLHGERPERVARAGHDVLLSVEFVGDRTVRHGRREL